jgi:hypothetical protein
MRYVFVFHDGWQTFPKRVDIWTRTNHSRGRAIVRLVNHGRLPLTTLLALPQNVYELRFGKIGSRKRWRTRLSTSGCRLGTMNFTTKRPWLHGVKKRQSADLKRNRRLPKYWNAEREGTWNRQVTRGFSSNSADIRTIYGTVDRLPRVSISNHGNTDVTSQDKCVVSIYQTN